MAKNLPDISYKEDTAHVPNPSHRHAAPSAPWSWVDLSDEVDPQQTHADVYYTRVVNLSDFSLKDAELHSAERFPPPRCHPGTRVELRKEVYAWLIDENREQNMLWLFGPAGIGKSAIAQTIGELAEDLGIFGAAVFFSRGRKVENSSLFITSIAHQLAQRHPSYKNLTAAAIKKKPGILTSTDKRVQLRELLVEPFLALKRQGKPLSELLILIDGLDEYHEEAEQLALVRLIADAVDDFDSPPFLWLICSRPEHHLKEIFLDGGLSNTCLGRDLLPQEPGADADIERYLTDGLRRITEQYRDRCNADTALSLIKDLERLNKLTRTASGVFVVASSILVFVGDPIVASPASQLQIVLETIDGTTTEGGGWNFLAPIDALYRGVPQALEKNHLPQALDILGACAISPPIPALHLANLLGISREVFYSALRSLHAFVSVPRHTTTDTRVLDSTFRIPTHIDSEPPLSISHDILSFAAMHTWDLCMNIWKPQERELLLKMVATFDFRRLQLLSGVLPVPSFIRFIRWIYMLGTKITDLADMVRTCCDFVVDRKLLEKCKAISRPLGLDSVEENDKLEESPRHVFAGFDLKIVIVLFVPEAVMIYSIDDIDDL